MISNILNHNVTFALAFTGGIGLMVAGGCIHHVAVTASCCSLGAALTAGSIFLGCIKCFHVLPPEENNFGDESPDSSSEEDYNYLLEELTYSSEEENLT